MAARSHAHIARPAAKAFCLQSSKQPHESKQAERSATSMQVATWSTTDRHIAVPPPRQAEEAGEKDGGKGRRDGGSPGEDAVVSNWGLRGKSGNVKVKKAISATQLSRLLPPLASLPVSLSVSKRASGSLSAPYIFGADGRFGR